VLAGVCVGKGGANSNKRDYLYFLIPQKGKGVPHLTYCGSIFFLILQINGLMDYQMLYVASFFPWSRYLLLKVLCMTSALLYVLKIFF
jgi:hypothetical protein